MTQHQLKRRISILLAIFIVGLVMSGLTAFPLQWEVSTLAKWMGATDNATPAGSDLLSWIVRVRNALNDTYAKYPFMAYGTDWLAFGHIVIGIAFIGAFRNPVRNIWILEFRMIACLLVIPTALIRGQIRHIPVYWRLIDCSFGVFGIIPLWICRGYILQLAKIAET